MGRPVLEVCGVWVHRHDRAVCRAVSFDLAAGEVLALVGAAGAGKSALLRCLALEERPTAGTIRLHGVDIAGASGEQRRQLQRRAIRLLDPASRHDGLDGRGPDVEVVLIDEPLAGVGVAERARVLDRLARLRRQPTSTVVATRDIDIAGVLADHVVVLDHGEVVEDGSVTQVVGAPRSVAAQELRARRRVSA